MTMSAPRRNWYGASRTSCSASGASARARTLTSAPREDAPSGLGPRRHLRSPRPHVIEAPFGLVDPGTLALALGLVADAVEQTPREGATLALGQLQGLIEERLGRVAHAVQRNRRWLAWPSSDPPAQSA
jgi:hypothetical protein